jgi:hypothetical protein
MRASSDPKRLWLGTRRCAKSGPPRRGCPVKLAGSVASLAGATSPCRTPRLPSEFHRAIKVMQPNVIWL